MISRVVLLVSVLTVWFTVPLKAQGQWVPTNGPGYSSSVHALATLKDRLLSATDDGVFASTNYGTTWLTPFPGLPGPVSAILVNGNTILAIHYGTIYQSINDGASWAPVDSTTFAKANATVILLAQSGTTLFAATYATSSFGDPEGRVFHSVDSGKTWQAAATSFPTRSAFFAMTVHGNTALLATAEGIYRSEDNGVNWIPSDSGFGSDMVFSVGVVDSILFAQTISHGIVRSIDGGLTWKQTGSSIANDTVNIFAGSERMLFAGTNNSGVCYSTDEGNTWNLANNGLTGFDIQAICFAGSYLFAGSVSQGSVFRSSDSGSSWSRCIAGMPNKEVTCVASMGINLVAGSGGAANPTPGSQFLSTDLGANWEPKRSDIEARSYVTIGGSIFAAAGDVFRSDDSGSTWTTVASDPPLNSFICLATNGRVLFAGGTNGVYCSTDSGLSWSSANGGLTNNQIYSLAMIGSIIFAGADGSGVFRSMDSGKSWVETNSALDSTFVNTIAVLGSTLFVGTDGTPAIIRSDDSGTTWRTAQIGFPRIPGYFISAFTCFDKYLLASSENGLFFSRDTGVTWIEADTGLPAQIGIASVATLGQDIFVGTNGRGVWHRAASELIATNTIQYTPLVSQKLVSFPNPLTSSTTVQLFSIQTASTAISILNLLGQPVARLFSGELAPGEHSFAWDASRVPPGMYVGVVRSGGKVEQVPMMVVR